MRSKQIFKNLVDSDVNFNITGYARSPDGNQLLLVINKDFFTVISIKQDDEDNYYLVEGDVEDPFNIFYEEDLIELNIMTKQDIAIRHQLKIDKSQETLYKEYLRLKAMFETH